jgi:hypothetical protein
MTHTALLCLTTISTMTLNIAEQNNTQQLSLMTLSATAGISTQHNDTKHYVMLCAAFYRNAQCRYPEYHYAELCFEECLYVDNCSAIFFKVTEPES